MKTIKDLTIKATFRVALSDVKIPNKIYDALAKCYDEGGEVPAPDECIIKGDSDLAEAYEWLFDNIHEADAMDTEYEIEEFGE